MPSKVRHNIVIFFLQKDIITVVETVYVQIKYFGYLWSLSNRFRWMVHWKISVMVSLT